MSTVTEQTQAREAARILAAQDLPEDRTMLLALFAQMRSGRGFLNALPVGAGALHRPCGLLPWR
jgi:hypothetical protein